VALISGTCCTWTQWHTDLIQTVTLPINMTDWLTALHSFNLGYHHHPALHPSGVAKSSTSFGWGKGGKVTATWWQVALCDPIWHVISRGCDEIFDYKIQTAISALLTYLFLNVSPLNITIIHIYACRLVCCITILGNSRQLCVIQSDFCILSRC